MLWAKHDRKLASDIVREELTGSLTFPDSAEIVELDFSINHQFEMVSISDQDGIPASGPPLIINHNHIPSAQLAAEARRSPGGVISWSANGPWVS